MTIKSITQTCDACPSQWEGELDDGRFFYVRYRWGNLQLGIGKDDSEAVRVSETIAALGDSLDGYLDEQIMLDYVTPHLLWGFRGRKQL